MSTLLVQFLGITFIAAGVMCFVARDAQKSPGRTGVLSFLMVSQLLFLYMDVRTMMAGEEGNMNYLDLAVHIVIGLGAL